MALFQIGRALVSEPLLQAARPLAISALTQTQAFHVTSAPQQQSAVFEKLGGKKAVKLAVEKFYEKVLKDPVCAPYFENIDMAKQRAKQMNFMVLAFGGPAEYQGRSMYEAHKNMGLTDKEFNAVTNHFITTLQELGIDQKTIDEAAKVVETTRDAVLTRKNNM